MDSESSSNLEDIADSIEKDVVLEKTCPETGRVGIFTVGCADAFWVDDPSAGIILFENELKKPINPETKEQRLKRDEEYSKRKQHHGWRGNR